MFGKMESAATSGTTDGKCQCTNAMYTGIYCERPVTCNGIAATNPNVCSGNGKCHQQLFVVIDFISLFPHIAHSRNFTRKKIKKMSSQQALEEAFNAVSKGNKNALVLMDLHSFINSTKSNETLLYTACNGGHVEIVKLLLSVSGIDVNKGVSIVSIY